MDVQISPTTERGMLMFGIGWTELLIVGLIFVLPAGVGIVVLIVVLINKGKTPPVDTTSAPVQYARCPHCEHKVSTRASTCTSCGGPLK